MENFILRSVFFKNLKGLKEVNVSFSETLTAIMGVNGSGKTTVIHALACLYQPEGKGENHRFPEFFVPNTDSLWNGSELSVVNDRVNSSGVRTTLSSRKYSKAYDRWNPRYASRPKRNVYYIGIDSCLPEIEKKTNTSRIIYTTTELTDRQAKKTIEYSANILNKDYVCLLDNTYALKHFNGVKLQTGLKYSSLSMGSGEQRIIKIIDKLLKAEAYSLVLIDEIDLLLHISALRKLIKTVYEIAKSKHIQIVFTTHSLEMINLSKYVKIQYISNLGNSYQSMIYEKITPDLIYSMTGQRNKTHCIYVEDEFAKCIVNEVVKKQKMSTMVDIITYGAIENAFTLAASFVIQNEEIDNRLVVLDGDRYITNDEKVQQINKKLTGTESDADEKREAALSIIKEFVLPDGTAPEQFIHDIIIKTFPKDHEMYVAALEIRAVGDTHEWIFGICEKLDEDISSIIREVFIYAWGDEEFHGYLEHINNWLESKRGTDSSL